MSSPLWLPSAAVRQRDGLAAAVLEPRRVHLLNVGTDCKPQQRTLAEVGVCGHSISALLLDPDRDVVYTCGSDATLRAWNIKSTLQRWSWTDPSPGRTTLGRLRIRNARQDIVDQQWRHERNFARMSGEPQLFVTRDILWVSGPSTLRAFDRKQGQEMWTLHLDSDRSDASLCMAHGDALISVQYGVTGDCNMVAYASTGTPGMELWRQNLHAELWVHWLIGLNDQLYYVEHSEQMATLGDKSHQELVSRDLATGELHWRCAHDRHNGAGPIVKLEACGNMLWCFCGTSRELRAIDPSNGSTRWSIELTAHVHAHGYFLTTTCVAVWGSKVFVSDGKAIHAVDLRSGEPVRDWAQAGVLKGIGNGFHDQPPPTLLSCSAGLLVLKRTVGERTATECTLSCFDCKSSGDLIFKEGAHRSSGSITLHAGMDGLIGSSRIPSAGNDTSAAGQIALHVFHADSGVLWAVHSVPTNEAYWRFVRGGVVVHVTRDKALRGAARSSIDGHNSRDSLQCLDHQRQHDYAISHNVASVSSGHLDLAVVAAQSAALRWTWSPPSGKDIDAWAVHPSGEIFVLTHDRVVHVLDSLSGVAQRSFSPGSAVPASRHRRQEASAGLKDLLLCEDNLMIRGVNSLDGIMFSTVKGNEKWRPDTFGGALIADAATKRPGTRRPSTAGAGAEVSAGAVLLSSSIVVTLGLAPIERGSNKATGTIFGRMVRTGNLLWSMPLCDELRGPGAVKSGVEVWPLRRLSKETKLLSLDSTPSADAAALHVRRLTSALVLRETTHGNRLYITTRRSSRIVTGGLGQHSRPASQRYHVRCFDASPADQSVDAPHCLEYQLGPPYHGEVWHYPPGHVESGWESAISCMEVTTSVVVVGSTSGRLYMLNSRTGNLIKTIDWLHVDEIAALANGKGMLWSASSQMAALRLRPLARFGVVAAATQTQLSTRSNRFRALWLVTIEFWLALLLALVESIQLLRFAAASEVCSESSSSSSTCIRGYQMEAVSISCSHNSTQNSATGSACCACGGGSSSDNILELPPSVSVVLRKVSDFGLDAISPILAVWMGCGLILSFLTVFLLAEPVKRRAFFSPDGLHGMLLSALSLFANLMCQPMLVPTLRLVSRGIDCSYYDGTGWLLDNSGIRFSRPQTNTSNGDSQQSLLIEHEWQRCWESAHTQILAIPALLCLFFYIPACVRLLRVGGSLMALAKDVSSVFMPWSWCTSKDDDVESPNRHPFSMRDGAHKVLVVSLKAVGVLATVFLGTKHRILVGGICVVIAICMAVMSCTLSPFHGEAANCFRAAVDFAVLTSYVAALALAMLLEQPATYGLNRPGAPTALYYPSESRRETAKIIARWLPGLVCLSLICGWFARRLAFKCKVQRARRRVLPHFSPPSFDAASHSTCESEPDGKVNGDMNTQPEQNAALIIQRRQRTRSSGRRLALLLSTDLDSSTAGTTSRLGFATTKATTSAGVSVALSGVPSTSELGQRLPVQLPPLVPSRTGAKHISKAKHP